MKNINMLTNNIPYFKRLFSATRKWPFYSFSTFFDSCSFSKTFAIMTQSTTLSRFKCYGTNKGIITLSLFFLLSWQLGISQTLTVGPVSTGATYIDFETAVAAASDGDLIQLLPLSGGITYGNDILKGGTTAVDVSGIEVTIDGGGNTIQAGSFTGQAFIFAGTAAKTMKLQNITLCGFRGSIGAALIVNQDIGTAVEFENVIVTQSTSTTYAVRFEGPVIWNGGSISGNDNIGLSIFNTTASPFEVTINNANIDCNGGTGSFGAGIHINSDETNNAVDVIINGGAISGNGSGNITATAIYSTVGGASDLTINGTAFIGNLDPSSGDDMGIIWIDDCCSGTTPAINITNAVFDNNVVGPLINTERGANVSNSIIRNNTMTSGTFGDGATYSSCTFLGNNPNPSIGGSNTINTGGTTTIGTSNDFNFSGYIQGTCGGGCTPNTIANIGATISYACLQEGGNLVSTMSGDWYYQQSGGSEMLLSSGTSTATIPAGLSGYTVFWQDVATGTDPVFAGTVVAASGVNAGSPQSIDIGQAATLSAAPASGTWSIASGPDTNLAQFSSTTDPVATFTPTTIGTYNLEWSDGGTCPGQVAITVNPLCEANAGFLPTDPTGCQEITSAVGGSTTINLSSYNFNNTSDYTQVYFIANGATGTDAVLESIEVVGTGITPVAATSVSNYTAGTYVVYVINYRNGDAAAVTAINALTTLPTTVADLTAIATSYSTGACMVRAANEMIVEVCDPTCSCDDGTDSGVLTTLTTVPGSYNPAYGQTYILTNNDVDPLILDIQESAIFTGLAAGNYKVYAINYSLVAAENPFINGATWTAITANTTTISELSTTPGLADACFELSAALDYTVGGCPAVAPVGNDICLGNTTTVNGNPSGGSGTYSTHAWSITGGTATNITLTNSATQIVTVDASGGTATAGTVILSYTVTDDETCSKTGSVTINIIPQSPATVSATAATCTGNFAHSDGTLTINGFTTEKYDFTIGTSYTGGLTTYAAATAIPVGGVITNTLANPASATSYTVRIFNSSDCFIDITVVLNPANCMCPTITISGDAAVCQNAATSAFTQSGGTASGVWSLTPLSAGSITSSGIFTASATATGSVTVTYTEPSPSTCAGTATITVNAIPTLAATGTNPTICGGSNGSIAFTLSDVPDGAATINYADVNGNPQTLNGTVSSNAMTITGLSQGTYNNLTITVANCTSIEDVDIVLVGINFPTLAATGNNPTTCGGTEGSIDFTFTDAIDGPATINYEDELGNPQTMTGTIVSNMMTIGGLTQGTYNNLSITIFGCTSMQDVDLILSDPTLPTLTGTPINPTTCDGNNGIIIFTLTGVPDGPAIVNYEDENGAPQTLSGSVFFNLLFIFWVNRRRV